MTTTAPPTASSASAAGSATPTAGSATSRVTRLRRRAVWLVVVGLGVAALAALALATAQPAQDLDPDGTGPGGGRALVEVLRHHGVDVQIVRSAHALVDAAPAAGTTVVMADPEYLGQDSASTLATATSRADRLVLLSPTTEQLAAMALPLTAAPAGAPAEVRSGCSTNIARAGDTVTLVDDAFVAGATAGDGRVQRCFVLSDPQRPTAKPDLAFGAAMAVLPLTADHPEIVALGMTPAFTNRFLASGSHAGLAVRALGHSPRLIWYQPGLGDLASAGRQSSSPWPAWLSPAAVVLATAVVMLALVRGRRMGALVTERLPVVVRAVETTESRGRIYRRARDRERAAQILRLATIARLARRLGLPTADLTAVVPAASAASGMPPAEVAALLAGAPPTTDTELHTIAGSLSRLEERVRTP